MLYRVAKWDYSSLSIALTLSNKGLVDHDHRGNACMSSKLAVSLRRCPFPAQPCSSRCSGGALAGPPPRPSSAATSACRCRIAARGRRQDRRAARSPLAFGLHCLLRGARYRGDRRRTPPSTAPATCRRCVSPTCCSNCTARTPRRTSQGRRRGHRRPTSSPDRRASTCIPRSTPDARLGARAAGGPRVQRRLVQAEPQAGRGGDAPSRSGPHL